MKKVLLTTVLLLLLVPAFAFAQTQTVTLTCIGDTLIGSNDLVSVEDYAFQRYIEQFGYAYPLAKLQSLLANDDITLANLECVLNDDAPAQKSRYSFRGPTDYVNILTQGSVEVVNLANNHSGDYGQEGFDSTIQALESANILYSGSITYGNYTCIWEKDGIKIGFFGLFPLYYKDHEEQVVKSVEALKAAGCQVIIASVHAGMEYRDVHGDLQTRYGRIARSLGANIVVGTHPHVPQGVSVTNGVTQLFSLGNAVFGGNTGVDEEVHSLPSVIAQFSLTFEDGVYTGHQLTLWPIHISGVTPENNYQPVLLQGEDAARVMRMIQRDSDVRLADFVDGEGAVQAFVPWK
ncbi:MAG TPA: CapA family protein [Candidatus Limiplasma sp.]|nr:CapA family protein [Candidatus Limiplasma sp.]HRX09725.1 CapA family protein [Candidatus Limiplasma sp.]